MNAIRFWRDVWQARNGARPVAWCLAAMAVMAMIASAFGAWE